MTSDDETIEWVKRRIAGTVAGDTKAANEPPPVSVIRARFPNTCVTDGELLGAWHLSDALDKFEELLGFKLPASTKSWSTPGPTGDRKPFLVLTTDDVLLLCKKLFEAADVDAEVLDIIRETQESADRAMNHARGHEGL